MLIVLSFPNELADFNYYLIVRFKDNMTKIQVTSKSYHFSKAERFNNRFGKNKIKFVAKYVKCDGKQCVLVYFRGQKKFLPFKYANVVPQ